MYVAMIIGVSLVYLVMVATLGSLKIPFIVVLSMPLAVVGRADRAGHHRPVVEPAGIDGLPSAGGHRGHQRHRAADVCPAASTVGLRPVGCGNNGRPHPGTANPDDCVHHHTGADTAVDERFGRLVGAELATVVIGGLLSSTFLTLVAVPVVYMLFEETAPNLYRRILRVVGLQRPRVAEAPFLPNPPQKAKAMANLKVCHCEKRSDVAIPPHRRRARRQRDCHASLS